jgi:hypothetical protein
VRSERWLGRTEFRPKDYMRTFVIDDEFFNQSAIEATPRSSCRPALEKRLDTADIVRDGRKTGLSVEVLVTQFMAPNCARCRLFSILDFSAGRLL